jgi:hypothetical protein
MDISDDERRRAQVVLRELLDEQRNAKMKLATLDPFHTSPMRAVGDLLLRVGASVALFFAASNLTKLTPAANWILLLWGCGVLVQVWDHLSIRRAVTELNRKVDAIRELLDERVGEERGSV